MKKTLLNSLKVLLAGTLLLLLVASGIRWNVARASSKVEEFCQSAAPGQPIDTARTRAKTLNFSLLRDGRRFGPETGSEVGDGVHTGTLWAMETGFVFLRFFCTVEYDNDKVTSTKTRSLD